MEEIRNSVEGMEDNVEKNPAKSRIKHKQQQCNNKNLCHWRGKAKKISRLSTHEVQHGKLGVPEKKRKGEMEGKYKDVSPNGKTWTSH